MIRVCARVLDLKKSCDCRVSSYTKILVCEAIVSLIIPIFFKRRNLLAFRRIHVKWSNSLMMNDLH